MPSVTQILRSRRSRRRKLRRLPRIGGAASALAAGSACLLGALAMGAALAFANLQQGLPDPAILETLFGPPGQERFQPTRLVDRDQRASWLTLMHPLAADYKWASLDPASPTPLPSSLIQATLAFQDPTFWENPGYEPRHLPELLLAAALERELQVPLTITQQLAEQALLPPDQEGTSPLTRWLRSALLAARITERFPKERIVAWYLNSAYFGNQAFGADAAALVYFGKHVEQLTPAESAMLAPIPQAPGLNPADSPTQARARQRLALQAMADQGLISEKEARQAGSARLNLRPAAEIRAGWAPDAFARLALAELAQRLGPQAMQRGGLTVITTLDPDLQAQTTCTLRTHLRRMAGDPPNTVDPAPDGSPCLSAGLLPPLRPRDAGLDHRLDRGLALVLDPATGQIMALDITPEGGARAQELLPAGTALQPFIYLAAFSRGYTPASMVLDLPPDPQASDLSAYQGPVRMRTALANAYPAAAARALELAGPENVLRAARQMGLLNLQMEDTGTAMALAQGGAQIYPLNLARALGVIANQGAMVGAADAQPDSQPRPTTILSVLGPAGELLYSYQPRRRAVLSPQLAYLMADVLSDEAARWPSLGEGNPLEIGRPAAAYVGQDPQASSQWALGFTPQRVIAVWVGSEAGRATVEITPVNGAAPVWHALALYATRDLPPEGWDMPPGVNPLEVCDPSGLLPTIYCPRVVREVFIQGTEPTSYDDFYRPIRVNRETDKLATLFTPLDLVEERVYLIPPPEAAAWARQVGIERPPEEYDTYTGPGTTDPQVNIASPEPFAMLRGAVTVQGAAWPDDFAYFRLQYGEGLNPTRWVQIGQDQQVRVWGGSLGRWDTSELNGLFTLQLVVVGEEGRVLTAAVPVTVDNSPPQVRLLSPLAGQKLSMRAGGITLEVEAGDEVGLDRVVFYVDGRRVGQREAAPFTLRWEPARPGEYEIRAEAYDVAGNMADTSSVTLTVTP